MKNILTIILLTCACSFIGCKSEKEKNIEKMSEAIRKNALDNAFKGNFKIDILEFNFIKCDTINQNKLDSIKRLTLAQKISVFIEEQNSINKRFAKEVRSLRTYSVFGPKNSLLINSKENIADLEKQFMSSRDSMNFYFAKDSVLAKAITNTANPLPIYQAKVFIKATSNQNGIPVNYMDTIYYHFNHKLELLK